nr:hypothetical protein [Tanacetum cinerariifolium]
MNETRWKKRTKVVVKEYYKRLELEDSEDMKKLLLENDRLLELIISQDIVYTAVYFEDVIEDYENFEDVIEDYESMRNSYTKEYNRNLTLEAELSK